MKIEDIEAKGIRVNNLKNVNLSIPLGKFTVITGVSGSGKSSLAFDTLYAEGQRRYVESLSAYARQFLGRMAKPECDYIKGLPPAIAIEQKVNTRNPRSTVGTATEIYDYLRMLYARVGHTYSPISGSEVRKHSVDDIVNEVCSYPEGTRLAIFVDILVPGDRTLRKQLEVYVQSGYTRVERDGELMEISDFLASPEKKDEGQGLRLLIDRLSVQTSGDERSRLADSVETATYEGHGACIVKIYCEDGPKEMPFSSSFSADGMNFREPSDLMFNFNNPYGACPVCEGFGQVLGISEDLVVPDKTLSVYQGAVQCWRGEKMSEVLSHFIRMARKLGFPIHKPYAELTSEERDILWHGKGEWDGIDGFFRWVDENQYKIQYRVLKARYRGKSKCPECHGNRLRKDAQYVKIAGRSISEIVSMSISEVKGFFDSLHLPSGEEAIAARLLLEIRSRLTFLEEVGLGYLTLDRLSSTLSGGESQRINLATSLGSSLMGSLYILDEPSIGLHSRDTQRLIGVLHRLKDAGNTVVVVEHDEDIMLAADNIVDVGPDAGSHGGEIVYSGDLKKTLDRVKVTGKCKKSHTLEYLSGQKVIPYDTMRRPWKRYIEVRGAIQNNLKDISVKFPLGVMTVVSGVSGSGKSTLVRDILYRSLCRRLDIPGEQPGACKGLKGDVESIGAVEFIDQNPIGTSTRSNPATYLKAYDEIRRLFADLPLARRMNFSPGYFSFNTDGGRCDECKGEGVITIPMQFMADITVPCEVCGGKRFKEEILEVQYRGKSIFDFLEMTVDEAIAFLSKRTGDQEQKIIDRLKPLSDVGLGYIKLGQSSSTLSGGENQRVKLAYYLSLDKQPHTMFIFDEPTTGLHFHDISTLLKSLRRLTEAGHTVVIIEHNMDIIKNADWVIDIGPEGGEAGGRVVVEGTPEDVVACETSYTGKYLKSKLKLK